MYNDDRRNLTGVIIILLLAAALVAFFIFVKVEEKKDLEEAIQEAEEYEAEMGSLRGDADKVYNSLVERLTIPDFVIWGDEGAAGVNGSLVPEFTATAEADLFGSFDSAYSAETQRTITSDLTVNMYNMGVTREGMKEILARSGAKKMVTRNAIVIPAGENGKVNLEIADEDGNDLHFAGQKNVKFGEVTISGIPGKLAEGDGEYDADHPHLAFVRARSGEETAAPEGTAIETELSGRYTDSIPVLFFDNIVTGSNGKASPDTGAAIADLKTLAKSHKPAADHDWYVIVVTAEEGSETDKALRDAFGDHYICNNKIAEDMTDEDYAALAEKVYETIKTQGCFDSVIEEVNKATAELAHTAE